MTIAMPLPIGVGGLALSAVASAIKALYGMGVDINDYLDRHIAEMKGSDNPTISRTGRILEMAKLGFGMGYLSSVVIISVGQFLLGNTFAAIATVATAATLSNPVAMTCAAIGAIYYGWGALSDIEREEMLARLSIGLEVGIELIKSIVGFVVGKTKELMSSKNMEEFKKFIGTAAAVFGKSLGDVTHKIGDMMGDTYDSLKKKSGDAMGKTIEVASDTYRAVSETAERTAGTIREKIEHVGQGRRQD